jgi:hypothetical protein
MLLSVVRFPCNIGAGNFALLLRSAIQLQLRLVVRPRRVRRSGTFCFIESDYNIRYLVIYSFEDKTSDKISEGKCVCQILLLAPFLFLPSMYKLANPLNKIQYMESTKLLHFSAQECNPQESSITNG